MLIKRTQILFDKEDKLLKKRKKAVEAILAFRKKYGKKLGKGKDSTSIIRKMRDERYGQSHIRRLNSY